ncbi:MAG TPA: hypothetical protein PKC69_08950 [Chitinophagaceae bacterium]|nr:hypothetical protein [Chitinophagaceae bacterium]
MNKIKNSILVTATAAFFTACTYSRHFTTTYYKENEAALRAVRKNFAALYRIQPFSLEIKDKAATLIGLELHTDSIKYVYEFRLDEPYFFDTLAKYKFDIRQVSELVNAMQAAHCTWVSLLDYYENYQPKNLLFISVRHKDLTALLKPEKYFTLAFFNAPQPYDEKNRLLDRTDKKANRKINDAVYRRINDSVFYALMEKYR